MSPKYPRRTISLGPPYDDGTPVDPVTEEPGLGVAWAEVRAVLPEKWLGPALTPYYPRGWEAEAHHQDVTPGSGPRGTGAVWGETPAGALRELLAKLRSMRP